MNSSQEFNRLNVAHVKGSCFNHAFNSSEKLHYCIPLPGIKTVAVVWPIETCCTWQRLSACDNLCLRHFSPCVPVYQCDQCCDSVPLILPFCTVCHWYHFVKILAASLVSRFFFLLRSMVFMSCPVCYCISTFWCVELQWYPPAILKNKSAAAVLC